jgi:hypothetical protein
MAAERAMLVPKVVELLLVVRVEVVGMADGFDEGRVSRGVGGVGCGDGGDGVLAGRELDAAAGVVLDCSLGVCCFGTERGAVHAEGDLDAGDGGSAGG